MKYFQKSVGSRHAVLTGYVQESSTELPNLTRCPAVLIFPGGAYAYCSDREAEPVALAFLNAGFNAFVLRYSTSQNCPADEVFPNALAEAEESLAFLHQQADELHIDPEQIAVLGFSAGGHLTAALGTMGKVRPAALLLGYAVFSLPGKALGMELPDLLKKVDDRTPPSFLFATQGDRLVPAVQSMEFAARLAGQKIPYEIHVFAYGDHGASLGTPNVTAPRSQPNPDAAAWFGMALRFLQHIFRKDVLVPVPAEVTEYGLEMKIGTLLDDPVSGPVVRSILPELDAQAAKQPGCRGLSLAKLQLYSNKMFDADKLAALEQALQKLN